MELGIWELGGQGQGLVFRLVLWWHCFGLPVKRHRGEPGHQYMYVEMELIRYALQ